MFFCPDRCWYNRGSPDPAWSSGDFCIPLGYCCFSVKRCQLFCVQRHGYLIWIKKKGLGVSQLLLGELGSRLAVMPGRGRRYSTQIKLMLGLTGKWVQAPWLCLPFQKVINSNYLWEETMLTAERGVQMRTRFRGRLAWENMSVWLRGGRVFSPGPDYFLYISISACLSVYSCFFCIFVHFSESPDTKQRISRQTRGRKWGKSRALGPVWLSCRNDRSSQALKAEPRGLNHGLVTNSGKHIWILRTLGGSSFAP